MLRMLSMSRYFKRQMHDIIECLKKHEELDVKVIETLLNDADESAVTQLFQANLVGGMTMRRMSNGKG